jgi:hypothetical protein
MMNEIFLKLKRLLSMFKRDQMITHRKQKTTPLYVKKGTVQSQVEEYTDNYTPIKREKEKL